MCGRAYITYDEAELEARYLTEKLKRDPLGPLKPNFNLSPTQTAPIIRATGNRRFLTLARWQFVPPWEPEFKTKLSTINAKSETVFDSRLYGKSILRQRCIVPLSGFYEWRAAGDGLAKKPFKIFQKKSPIMSMAGIFETWHPGTEEAQISFSILTTTPNALMAKIHNRMPVILSPEAEKIWLDDSVQDRERVASVLKACPASWLEADEISTAVNSPRNNRAELLEPVGEVID